VSIPTELMLLTGFLGSGKTTLLHQLLRQPEMADTAVIINEMGAIGLDHQLVERIDGETVLLDGGCVCCTVRSELGGAVMGLLQKSDRGEIPALRRIVIETTGLADPGPVVHALSADTALSGRTRMTGIVTTVDALHGQIQLSEHEECVAQVAVADLVIVTKRELASPVELARVMERVAHINPHATVLCPAATDIAREVIRWRGIGPHQTQSAGGAAKHHCDEHCTHHAAGGPHDRRIASHAFTFEAPMDWAVLSHWLGSLAFFHGDRILRVKGLLQIEGEARPVAVHAVGDHVHPPSLLEAWPDGERRSRLVFITRDLSRTDIEAALLGAPLASATAARSDVGDKLDASFATQGGR
jgi:G3E family GTPase